jgi:hypothetical protein
VPELLATRRTPPLPEKLRRLEWIALVILLRAKCLEDAEGLLTLIAERYEGRTLLISTDLMFSDWVRVFKDPIVTAAAINRLVHPRTVWRSCQREHRLLR